MTKVITTLDMIQIPQLDFTFDKDMLLKYQPERLNPEALEEGFFPPPWNFYEHPEKTEGWIEFQREMRKDPKYYLQGCDSPNTTNK
jgi:hypothetical protein